MPKIHFSKNNIAEGDVIRALENSKYVWRTVHGVANELNAPSVEVERVISRLRNSGKPHCIVVRSSRLSKDGQELFTTRSHFRKQASPLIKIVGALRNRVD